ncbi:hypothetical protein [Paenibacillus sp. sgz302251]|uniref:hypothetical protein n=1 Tax=Paenibacillus sp. sgz302251 TaxID=3414493 RepID=UPI003C7DAD04
MAERLLLKRREASLTLITDEEALSFRRLDTLGMRQTPIPSFPRLMRPEALNFSTQLWERGDRTLLPPSLIDHCDSTKKTVEQMILSARLFLVTSI